MASLCARLALLLACALAGAKGHAAQPARDLNEPQPARAIRASSDPLNPRPSAPRAASAAPLHATRAILLSQGASPALEFGVRIPGSNAEEFDEALRAELCASFVVIADLTLPGAPPPPLPRAPGGAWWRRRRRLLALLTPGLSSSIPRPRSLP
jgi:hypothetical protein